MTAKRHKQTFCAAVKNDAIRSPRRQAERSGGTLIPEGFGDLEIVSLYLVAIWIAKQRHHRTALSRFLA
jgi:hypothetical protein